MRGPEIIGRVNDVLTKRRLVALESELARTGSRVAEPTFVTGADLREVSMSRDARHALLRRADQLLDGTRNVFGSKHSITSDEDWFIDPLSGLTAPSSVPFSTIRFRDWPGSLKHVWEPSRHHELTVLAAAWRATGEDRYADVVSQLLTSWWRANPPFRGVHWTSGIELGIRIISWVWVRRLLDGSKFGASLFERNALFLDQLYCHQMWLAELPSRGSSANNHLVAEAAGQLIGALAFPCFPESSRWRDRSASILEREIRRQVGEDGLHREQAIDYHGFVLELFLLAALEAEKEKHPLSDEYWRRMKDMIDAVAAIVDINGRPPNRGDSDAALALDVDGENFDRWASLLSTCDVILGRAAWWPSVDGRDLRSSLLCLVGSDLARTFERVTSRPSHFASAGLTILREESDEVREIWCSCDAGPLGYLATASHGHADALSIEVRHEGVDVLVDPGTYTYQYEPFWREYFKSPRAHNTLEIPAHDQAISIGPFMWSNRSESKTLELAERSNGDAFLWRGVCRIRRGPGRRSLHHVRTVTLLESRVDIRDELDRSTPVVMRWHVAPHVECNLLESTALLSWPGISGRVEGKMELPPDLVWEVKRGVEDPPMGWYSPRYGYKSATASLEGRGRIASSEALETRLIFRKNVSD